MNPFVTTLLGGLLGYIKSKSIDEPRAKRENDLAAETTRLSPWTHMQAKPVQQADPWGDALQFAGTGAQIGQGFENNELDKQLKEAQIEKLLAKPANPWELPAISDNAPYMSTTRKSTWG